ncbi:MAG: LysM peptidoglycan-binding domain-containing protein [Solirubrobacteraceae bacterium]|nr:LysM peptidoglycan-binding domain-containing protein [Solirubrobacteraceae bacterium]
MVPVAATSAPAPARISVSGASHVVRSGESLWAIAAALVGADASPAQIAREVQRLWQLNADRIGTGSPDLLHVGTRLDLR